MIGGIKTITKGTVLLGAVIALAACAGDDEIVLPSIDEVHRTEGVPVEVRDVAPTTFRTYLSFTSSLTGAAESTAAAMLEDEVVGVLYRVGDYVEQGTPVVVFPPDNPSLNYEQARVGFESARTAYERVRGLYEDQGVSQQTYDDARTQFEISRANWESIQNITRVRAPISGYVTRINVFESDNVYAGDPLFTISDHSSLITTVWLTDRQVRAVTVGQPARATWQDVEVTGEVIQVDLAMDHTRRAFAAWLRFSNDDLAVQSGVTATVEIETYRNDEAIVLSQQEVVQDEVGYAAYLAREDLAHRVPVRVERSQGLFLEVVDGLEAGDQLITRGIAFVDDGTPVRIVNRSALLVQR